MKPCLSLSPTQCSFRHQPWSKGAAGNFFCELIIAATWDQVARLPDLGAGCQVDWPGTRLLPDLRIFRSRVFSRVTWSDQFAKCSITKDVHLVNWSLRSDWSLLWEMEFLQALAGNPSLGAPSCTLHYVIIPCTLRYTVIPCIPVQYMIVQGPACKKWSYPACFGNTNSYFLHISLVSKIGKMKICLKW